MQTLALFFLVAVAVGGVAWVFIYPILSGERRRKSAWRASPGPSRVAHGRARGQKSRREQVEGTLKEFEGRGKKGQSACRSRPDRAGGLTWSKRRFFMICAVARPLAFCLAVHDRRRALAALGSGSPAACGVPFWARVPEEAARSEVPRRRFPMPSTSSCAASRPACRCSTASSMITTEAPSRSRANSARSRDPDDRHAARRGLRQAV